MVGIRQKLFSYIACHVSGQPLKLSLHLTYLILYRTGVEIAAQTIADVDIVSSPVDFPSGETEINAVLRITDDKIVEAYQRFSVVLADVDDESIGSRNRVDIVIKDDDCKP